MRAREKRQSALSQIHNRKEAEEGRRRVKRAECVRSGDKEDELEKHVTSYNSHLKRVSIGWWLSRLTVNILAFLRLNVTFLAFLRLTVIFFPLRLTGVVKN